MSSLIKPVLGTDPKSGWKFYSLHLAASYITKEFFLVSNYRRCIKNSFDYDVKKKRELEFFEKVNGPHKHKKQIIAGAEELSTWSKKMEEEEFHELYIHSFIGMWSSFEAGIVNIITDFIKNDYKVAEHLASKFKKNRFEMSKWPWNPEEALSLAQRIESKAKGATENGGTCFFSRLQTTFSWLDIKIDIPAENVNYLAEANRVRNILLHRNGEISEKDVLDFPSLEPWVGNVMPFTKDKFTKYNKAISLTLISIMQGIASKNET
ncbi:hypothetical protein [Psychromonas antarctica]|uniref:hypothetical protein n=1 Tax=Psychromonas antarctica TaxID=67573 RepID=UPI001EE7CC26|nr:hypothetical protein [Psychromonas antarctica]MCG6202506.1 hypothetical protein [Psychromonas antarctica]